MATTIRLARHGTRNRPFYHLVVADSRRHATKQFIETLGYYDPASEPSTVKLKTDRVQFWYGKGATLSNTARVILAKQKVKLERVKTESSKAKAPKKAKAAKK